MEADNALTFENFSFQYRSQTEPSLRDINMVIRQGEKVLILGPSGSGKSTLVHCINGLIPNAFPGSVKGTLSIMGSSVLGAAQNMEIFDISKKVGTVLQDTDGQFVGLSAGEDIAFAAENDCVPTEEMRRRVREAAALVQIEDHLQHKPQELSGGQKQRVSLAGVLIDQVDILLFDEPLANLDPAAGKQTIELIDRIHRETGKTVLIVEHRLEDALHRPVDRIIVVDHGRIIADMKPEELLASDILEKTGIRPPLYISALRYAGVPVEPHSKNADVETIEFAPEALRAWDNGLTEDEPEKTGPPLLELKDISFRYNTESKPVLQDISLTIDRGSSVSLVGKNGAGKTTLASLICGFIQPVSGGILFEGRDLTKLSIRERALQIGYVMQNPNQMISLPLLFDEAALGLRVRGKAEGEIKDTVHETFRICGLYPFRNWPVSALSFGQKKRLTIASILVLGPSLLILDEPTAGQDFRHYSDIMEFLRKLNREQGITLLMITHDMHLMLEYSRCAFILSEGRTIRADSKPAAILTDSELSEAASLKLTSLYPLAIRAGIPDTTAFVRRFIAWDRKVREESL
ncbi:putative ABC transporter ATP-binding protein [Spirochaetia bacterium]|nr:putative ABC transporter ATP-binding protein [Spirochaetia bacterium]